MRAFSNISMKNIVIGAIALMVLSGGFALAMMSHTTSNPSYCLSCHATGETPDMGKPSRVHPPYSVVGCVECHARPGQIIMVEGYRGGFSADPEFVDKNCKRCHAQVATSQAMAFKYNESNINIPHSLHVADLGAACTTCHSNVSHDLSSAATNRPPMETCYACHDRAETPCEKCHKS